MVKKWAGHGQRDMRLSEHSIRLTGERVVLRPMTENDWDILMKWNNDADVIYFSDGENVTGHSLEQVQHIYRSVSQNAFCFIIENDDSPIGECWLQRMNLQRILEKYPRKDCRRIDLMIGAKELWGQGLGTEVISLLTRLGFDTEKADFIFGCDIADYNPRSLRTFERNGYHIDAKIEQPPGKKAHFAYDLVLSKVDYNKAIIKNGSQFKEVRR